jgi:hypothetical protein
MKSLLLAVSASVAFVASCSFHPQPLVLQAVGPSPSQPVVAGSGGTLVVYSAFDPHADFNDLPYTRHYSDYQIVGSQGTLLKLVRNNTPSILGAPAAVELPAGNYSVMARANGYRTVTVPVAIAAGQATTLHLEGSPPWPDKKALMNSNPVCLPKGEIVGWSVKPQIWSQP